MITTDIESTKPSTIGDPVMSGEIGELAAALSLFQGEVKQPDLNKSNPYFKSRYVDLSGCLKAAQPILAKNGLSVSQVVVGDSLVSLLLHKSGQWIRSQYKLRDNPDEQKRGSALTYAKRYAYCALLGIAADTDDDANGAMGNTAQSPKRKTARKAAAEEEPPVMGADEIAKAVKEMAAAASRDELSKAWAKYRIYPEVNDPEHPVHKACLERGRTLQAQK